MFVQHQLVQNQSLSLKITPQLVQSMNILQMASADLLSYLQEQMEENPAMEVEFDFSSFSRTRSRKNTEEGDGKQLELLSTPGDTLETVCLSQLRLDSTMDKTEYRIAAFLVGNLNDNGYLTLRVDEISRCLGEPMESVERALQSLQMLLEPAGIGARNLQECLEIQIRRDPEAHPLALSIVRGHLQQLGSGSFEQIAEALHISVDQVKQALHYIRQLNPRPGLSLHPQPAGYIVPDAYVRKAGNSFIVIINESVFPKVYVNSLYKDFQVGSEYKGVKPYITRQIGSVQGIIRSLEQRKSTLIRVIEAIVELQRMFFEKGSAWLKPMTMRTIAEKLGINESTVSRAVQHKWIQTPHGLVELKYFFMSGLAAKEGDEVSSTSVKEKIRQLIEEENKEKPLSDQQITDLLQKAGIEISRRTVMKYREEMRILSSRMRRQG